MSRTTTKIIIRRKNGEVASQYALGIGEHLIGRESGSGIFIEDDHISRQHAKLIISADAIEIEDLESTSGTFLEGMAVRGRIPVKPGQRVHIGNFHLDIERVGFGELVKGARLGEGRFTLIEKLGQGGMGEVWLAKDEQLEEEVALKKLPPEVAANTMALSDMRREVQKSRALTHPNIIRIHDLVQPSGEDPLITLEYVDGKDLTAIAATKTNCIFSWEEIREWLLQLCDALKYSHGEKIVHRDLKPSNIMITRDGRLKLADFGIAATLTGSSMEGVSGTPPFMSPQQIKGEAPQATDDIYAFGATIYVLLTSKPPFYTGDVGHQVLNVTPKPMDQRLSEFGFANEIPPYIHELVMACLAKDPEGRPQSMDAIREWIKSEGEAKGAPPNISTKNKLKIFISYRRDDSQGSADYLYSLLEKNFGKDNIFYDIAIDSIPPGGDFAECLDKQVSQCDVLLAVIGRRWLEVTTEEGTARLHDENDFVRIEIASALTRDIMVIPVLVEKAEMPPKEKLPPTLEQLAGRQAAQVRPGPDFRRDSDHLIKALEGIEQSARKDDPGSPRSISTQSPETFSTVILSDKISGQTVEPPSTEIGELWAKANQGDAYAQYSLGARYRNGEGVEQNYEEAVKWYLRAAEQGNSAAQFNLGWMYGKGEGVEQDFKEAVKWYRKAAEQGYVDAQFILGFWYKGGERVEKDGKEAVKWFRKAAEQGNAGAQFNLGLMYDTGDGVEKDAKEAVKWFRKAAEQGDVPAQIFLGRMYHIGGGVLEDYVTAYAWWNLATANGDEDAKKFKGNLAKKMTPDQITKAQKLSKEMVKKNPKLVR